MDATGDHTDPMADPGAEVEGALPQEPAPHQPLAPAWHERPAVRTCALILAVLSMLVLMAVLFPSRYWRF